MKGNVVGVKGHVTEIIVGIKKNTFWIKVSFQGNFSKFPIESGTFEKYNHLSQYKKW